MQEALPILYQQNTFYFCSPYDISLFGNHWLLSRFSLYHPSGLFGYISEPHGRRSLIQTVILRLGDSSGGDRAKLTKQWADFLQVNRDSNMRNKFPALERLTLDLSDWRPAPGETEALNVQPLIEKFRRAEGLQELTVVGLHDQSNLSDLKNALLRNGGRFLCQ